MYRLRTTFRFSAAHYLPSHSGKCANIHGHTYKVEVFVVANSLNKSGMVVDFGEIKAVIAELDHLVDHCSGGLNELEMFKDMEPTAENMAREFFYYFKKAFNHLLTFRLDKVRVHEDPDETWAEYEERIF